MDDVAPQRLNGAKFRRQLRVGGYIADCFSAAARLIVEADGSRHGEQGEYDDRRCRWLEREGSRVIRFRNNDVLAPTKAVLAAIAQPLNFPRGCAKRPPPSPLQGGGQ